MRRMVFVLAGVTLVATSCDRSTPTALEPPLSAPRFDTFQWFAAAATGAGTIDLSTAGVDNASFNLNATRSAGKAKGTFRQRRETSTGVVDFTANVTCLSVDKVNRRAWIGGVVTKNNSTNPAFMTSIHQVGKDVWFRVVDYRRKDSDPADRSTTLGFEGAAGFITSLEYCAGQPWPTPNDARTFPLLKGDLNVRW